MFEIVVFKKAPLCERIRVVRLSKQLSKTSKRQLLSVGIQCYRVDWLVIDLAGMSLGCSDGAEQDYSESNTLWSSEQKPDYCKTLPLRWWSNWAWICSLQKMIRDLETKLLITPRMQWNVRVPYEFLVSSLSSSIAEQNQRRAIHLHWMESPLEIVRDWHTVA